MKQEPNKATSPKRLHINFVLQDDEVARFLKFKAEAFLRNNSEAGRKLMLERLQQVEQQAA
jgi:hypothetical protein